MLLTEDEDRKRTWRQEWIAKRENKSNWENIYREWGLAREANFEKTFRYNYLIYLFI
jgi:hypothetical protein